jgi:hypothetical protein
MKKNHQIGIDSTIHKTGKYCRKCKECALNAIILYTQNSHKTIHLETKGTREGLGRDRRINNTFALEQGIK